MTFTQKNIIFKLGKQSLALGTFMALLQPILTAFLTRKQQRIQQTSIVIRNKKMVVADGETVSVLGNNWVNLCCRNHCAMGCGCDRAFEQRWIDSAVRELAESRLSPSIPYAVTARYSASQAVVCCIRWGQMCEILRSARHQIVGRRFCLSQRYGKCVEKNKY